MLGKNCTIHIKRWVSNSGKPLISVSLNSVLLFPRAFSNISTDSMLPVKQFYWAISNDQKRIFGKNYIKVREREPEALPPQLINPQSSVPHQPIHKSCLIYYLVYTSFFKKKSNLSHYSSVYLCFLVSFSVRPSWVQTTVAALTGLLNLSILQFCHSKMGEKMILTSPVTFQLPKFY